MPLDVIIIGAGLSSLSAARQLTAAGAKILLLEARDRVGGRAFTHTEGVDQPIDVGCAQIHGFNEGNPFRPVAETLGMKPYIVKGAGPPMVFGPQGLLSSADAGRLFAASAAASYSPSIPPPPPTASLASVLSPNLSPDVLGLARTAEIGAGIPLERIAAKWWNFGKPIAGTDGAPIGGYSTLVNKLVEEVEGAGSSVTLSAEVTLVEDGGEDGGVKVTTKDGSTYDAKFIISTIPLGVLKTSPPKFSPPLSLPFKAALERTQNGNLEKIVLLYNTAWWPDSKTQVAYLLLPLKLRSEKEPPSTLLDLFETTVFPVQNYLRTASTPHPSLLLYVGSTAAEFISNYSESEIGEAIHKYLATRFAVKNPPAPKKVLVTRWLADPFSRGETSAPTSLDLSQDGELGTPLDYITLSRSEWGGKLGFAGEHTVIDGRGSVGGAWISGEREGKRVADLLEQLKLW